MPVGQVKKYDGMEAILNKDANRQWDDATVGNCMFILATNTYTFDSADSTATDLLGVITAGDGSPINVDNPSIDENTVPGTTYIDSDAANFGASVTITAKFLICVQPVIAGTYAATARVVWCVDLDTSSGSASKTSTASDFSINTPTNGWIGST